MSEGSLLLRERPQSTVRPPARQKASLGPPLLLATCVVFTTLMHVAKKTIQFSADTKSPHDLSSDSSGVSGGSYTCEREATSQLVET